MKIAEFVEGFNKSTDKEKYTKKHIVNKYVGYAKKISDCKRVATVSMYHADDRGKLHLVLDTPMRHMLFIITVIQNYTDLEFDEKDVVKDFDLLDESGADSCILSLVGDDFEIYKSVLNMVVDDIMERERNLIDYFDNKLSAFSELIDSLHLEEVLRNAENQSNGDTTA